MKNLNKILNKLQIENILEKALNFHRNNYFLISNNYYIFSNNGNMKIIHDNVFLNKEVNMWLIYNPFFSTYEELNENNIDYYEYNELIYGFYQRIDGYVIIF